MHSYALMFLVFFISMTNQADIPGFAGLFADLIRCSVSVHLSPRPLPDAEPCRVSDVILSSRAAVARR